MNSLRYKVSRACDKIYHIAMICMVEIGFKGWPCTSRDISPLSNIASSIFAEPQCRKASFEESDQSVAEEGSRNLTVHQAFINAYCDQAHQ